MRWRILVAIAAVFTCASTSEAQHPSAVAGPTDSTRLTTITYISGQSVYVGAGRADGIREGSALEVVRSGSVIATLRATFLASHSSSCDIVSSTAPPAVGDSVRFLPAVEAQVGAASDSSAPQVESPPRTPGWRRPIRGHVGVRYLAIAQPNAPVSASMTEPSADVYLEATRLGGTPIGFVVDGRARHTIGSSPLAARDDETLVYQASLSLSHEGSGTRLSVGRQYSSALASVSLFDGAIAELNQPRWSIGGFGGTQPDVTTMSYSSEIREAGAYLQFHNVPDGSLPWSFTTGGVSSRDLGQINREFAFAQLASSGRLVSLYATQEVDVNRGWKRAAGEAALSPTSTFATLLVRLSDDVSLQGGVDNRRNVRLYRDYVSPETEFDDAYREGFWGGANLTLFQRIRVAGDARISRGGLAGDATYYTGTVGIAPVTGLGLEGHLRSTSYRTDQMGGWLHSVDVGINPLGVVRLEINGGLRTQQLLQSAAAVSAAPGISLPTTHWIGASVDVGLGASWYVVASGSRDGSGAELTNQLYGSLVYRF
jgi:hypothetical protein